MNHTTNRIVHTLAFILVVVDEIKNSSVVHHEGSIQ